MLNTPIAPIEPAPTPPPVPPVAPTEPKKETGPVEEQGYKITPLSTSSISVHYLTPIEGQRFLMDGEIEEGELTGRGGVKIYSDPLFVAVLDTIQSNQAAQLRSIRCKQVNDGTKLIFYQGSLSNVWGFIDVMQFNQNEDGTVTPIYNVRIYNSYLKGILKSDPKTQEFFQEIL